MLRLADETDGIAVGPDLLIDVYDQGSGDTVLVLHGVEGVPSNIDFLTELGREHRVIAPSHPGFDRSPVPDWMDSVEDLAYLYLSYLEDLDAREVTLVGLQFGGWIAAEMAVRSTERISRLVLADSVGYKFGPPTQRDIADVFAISRDHVDKLTYHDVENAPGPMADLPSEDVMRIARNEEALVRFGWDPYLHNPRLRRWTHRIDIPTLVVWGESDGIVPPAYGREIADLIPSASFIEVAEAGHRPQVEQPRETARLVSAFVSQNS